MRHLGCRWLLENREEGCTESAVDGACWNGHEEMVRWLVCDWGQSGTEHALDYAASTGRLEVQYCYWLAGPSSLIFFLLCHVLSV